MKKLMYSGAGLLAIAVAFVAFNLLSSQTITQARLDLTEQQLYTTSEGTRRILASLPEPVELYLFFSDKAARDLVPLRNYARRVEEMLRAYEREANGKIRLHIVDPEPFSEEEDQAAEYGLQGVPLNQGGDQLYFGLVGTSGADNRQVIPFFSPEQEEFLEYEVSRLLQSLAQPQQAVVGLLSGLPLTGGFDPQTRQPASAWMVLEEIRQQFQVESLKAGIDQIPAQVSVLMLVHPKGLPDASLYAIDQFVLRGGKLLVFVDPLSEADHSLPMLPGEPALRDSDLATLFKAWGLQLLPGKVLADGAYALTVQAGAEQNQVRHPGWLSLPKTALGQDDVVTAGLETLTLATAGILEPLPGASTRFVPLLQSSAYAMPVDVTRFENLSNPETLFRELKPSGERYTLAARVSGPAKSAYPAGIEGIKDGLQAADSINVIVVADTDLLSDRMWVQVQDFFGQRIPQPWADNATFTINALDNLSGSDALISVRSRGRFSRPFDVVTTLQREAESRFRQKEEELQQRLAETDQKLAELQTAQDPEKTLELTAEQQAAVQQFLQEKVRLRKELREVRFQLNADIDALGRTLKLLNIVLVPALLTLLVLGLWLWRRRRH
ncbi:GldG family protein [Pseudomonas sp. N040]|uniref:GldG family protein n=1 Tax=Pseudomonas sp. N040 TaxID=2785325 RepID=UPI0018A2FB66|nr:Gldg family protein [Pseudomonas sp. N040]MBF7729685.1 Gldg family protein [Pseudomonas sp. N040]MBW7013327.1 Gldg family protein [Pseudomonas sp. N040]